MNKKYEDMSPKERKENVLLIFDMIESDAIKSMDPILGSLISSLKNCYIYGYDEAKKRMLEIIKVTNYPQVPKEKLMNCMNETFKKLDILFNLIGGIENLDRVILAENNDSHLEKLERLNSMMKCQSKTIH